MDGDVLGDLPDDEPWSSSYGQSQRPPPQILCADVDADDDGSDFGASAPRDASIVLKPAVYASPVDEPGSRKSLLRGSPTCNAADFAGTRTSSEVSSMASSVSHSRRSATPPEAREPPIELEADDEYPRDRGRRVERRPVESRPPTMDDDDTSPVRPPREERMKPPPRSTGGGRGSRSRSESSDEGERHGMQVLQITLSKGKRGQKLGFGLEQNVTAMTEIYVNQVGAWSEAHEVGLRVNDVMESVNGVPCESLLAVITQLRKAKGNISLVVRRRASWERAKLES